MKIDIGLIILIFLTAPIALFVICGIAETVKNIIIDKRKMLFLAQSADRLRAENEELKKYLEEPCSICKNNPPSILCEESDCNCRECLANCKCKECVNEKGFKGFEWRNKRTLYYSD